MRLRSVHLIARSSAAAPSSSSLTLLNRTVTQRVENNHWNSFGRSGDGSDWQSHASLLSLWQHSQLDKSNRDNGHTRAHQCQRWHVQVSPAAQIYFFRFLFIYSTSFRCVFKEEWPNMFVGFVERRAVLRATDKTKNSNRQNWNEWREQSENNCKRNDQFVFNFLFIILFTFAF